MCNLSDFDSLSMGPIHRSYVENELEMWHVAYLPVGKTVLDLGAGCGETAFFYLNHGADHVICVESDPEAVAHLRRNFEGDSRVTILPVHVDSVKIDIEGSEDGMVLETHFPFRFRSVRQLGPNVKLWRLEKRWFSLHNFRIAVAHKIRITVLNKLGL